MQVPATIRGAKNLTDWPQRHAQTLDIASENIRKEAISQVAEQRDAYLSDLLQSEVATIDTFPNGFAGIEQSNHWYRSLEKRFGFASEAALYRSALVILNKRRELLLESVRPEIIAFIQQLSSEGELSSVLNRLMPIPGDNITRAGSAIYSEAQQRKQEIRDENFKALITAAGLVGAYYFDTVADDLKDEGDVLGSAGASFVKNLLLSASIENMAPSLSDNEVAAATSIVSRALDGELGNVEGISKDFLVQTMINQYKKKNPDSLHVGYLGEYMYEVYKQAQSSNKQ